MHLHKINTLQTEVLSREKLKTMEAMLIVQLSLKETSVSCTQTITATPWQVTLSNYDSRRLAIVSYV